MLRVAAAIRCTSYFADESDKQTFAKERNTTIKDQRLIYEDSATHTTIIKPDAVKKNAVGDIIEQFEKNGFRILAMKMLEISKHQAEQFYAVHASRPFYNSLTDSCRAARSWRWRWKKKMPSPTCAN